MAGPVPDARGPIRRLSILQGAAIGNTTNHIWAFNSELRQTEDTCCPALYGYCHCHSIAVDLSVTLTCNRYRNRKNRQSGGRSLHCCTSQVCHSGRMPLQNPDQRKQEARDTRLFGPCAVSSSQGLMLLLFFPWIVRATDNCDTLPPLFCGRNGTFSLPGGSHHRARRVCSTHANPVYDPPCCEVEHTLNSNFGIPFAPVTVIPCTLTELPRHIRKTSHCRPFEDPAAVQRWSCPALLLIAFTGSALFPDIAARSVSSILESRI